MNIKLVIVTEKPGMKIKISKNKINNVKQPNPHLA
jgi:hypothetical protein